MPSAYGIANKCKNIVPECWPQHNTKQDIITVFILNN